VLIDLHLHSNASDGLDSPPELVRLAAAAGVSTMALVDHDTLAGIGKARAAARTLDIDFIAGTELSVSHGARKMHMLVYFLEPGRGPLQDELPRLRDGRLDRNRAIVEKLNDLGYTISMSDVETEAAGESVGRPHIADALTTLGHVSGRKEAFSDLLRDGGAAYVERQRLTATDAITLARESGGVPVIAHPTTIGLTAEEAPEVFRELTGIGLGGIEAWYPDHSPDLRLHLASLAEDLGIAATGGSDYHGVVARDNRIATGLGDLKVPRSAVEQLQAQRR